MVERRTPEREVGGSILTHYRSPCCSLDQDIFTSQKVLVIPRKQWLRPDMTKLCCLGRKASTQTNKTSLPIVHRFDNTKRYS